ncbi:MAG: phage BigPaolini [Pseudomonadota bacterium]|jgi:hypothetical protein
MKEIPEFDHIKFISKISISDGNCWNWTGYSNSKKNGYGKFHINGKYYYSHRCSYLMFHGRINSGLVIDHICKNRLCCNPDHLREVSNRENVLNNSNSTSAANKIKTHCKHGHVFSYENTYRRKNALARDCRVCMHNRYLKRKGLNV